MGGWISGLMDGSMGRSMGGTRSNHQKSNKSGPNRDNSILFEDLLFVETPPPMGGYMGG